MNIEERKRLIVCSLSESMTCFLSRTTVAICGRDQDGKLHIGSGTCIKIEESYYICTAAHVLDSMLLEDLKIVHSREFSDSLICLENIDKYHNESLGIDMAFIRISNSEATRIGKTFVDENAICSDISDINDEILVVCGFPAALVSGDTEQEYFEFQPIVFLTSLDSGGEGNSSVDNRYRMRIEYPTTVIDAMRHEVVEVPAAPGISGGGVWVTNMGDCRDIWTPQQMSLLGINRAWRRGRYLEATRATHWLDFVRGNI